MDRRSFVSLGTLLASGIIQAAEYAPRALTSDEFTRAELFLELLLPGSSSARAMRYIDLGLAYGVGEVRVWKKGLAALEGHAVDTTLLTRLAAKEIEPETDAERLFVAAKRAAIEAYALSQEGQKEWLGYRGGVHRESFPGCREEH